MVERGKGGKGGEWKGRRREGKQVSYPPLVWIRYKRVGDGMRTIEILHFSFSSPHFETEQN